MREASSMCRLGLAGRMRVGKTTVAQYLARTHGFTVAAFADPIKEFARSVGWDGQKDERGRTLLQDIGTIVRKYDQSFWIRRMLASLPPDRPAAVDDMRMLLEHEMLTAAGFRTILITRAPALIKDAPSGTTGHVTEREVDLIQPWRRIDNHGSFEELYAQVETIMADWPG